MTPPVDSTYEAFIGTNSVRGSRGVYAVKIEADGTATTTGTTSAYNTGAVALSAAAQVLYAVSEGMTFRGQASGGCLAFRITATAELEALGGVPTLGQRPCNIALDPVRPIAYVANFYGGSIAALPLDRDGSFLPGRRIVTARAHVGRLHAMHAVTVFAGEELIGGMSVGGCEFVLYDAPTGQRVASYDFGGGFPRSVAHDDRRPAVYCMLQDPGDIHVLRRYGPGGRQLERLQVVSVQRPDYRGPFGTSALRISPTGTILVAATRRADTLSVFAIDPDDGTLTLTSIVDLPGRTPRDVGFTPDGRLLITALQASDEIAVHRVDERNGRLDLLYAKLPVPSPAAVAVRVAP